MKARRLHRPLAALMILLASGCAPAAGAAISPAGPSVPANLLRVDLHLDRPLNEPLDLRRVHLLDGSGQEIEGAFLGVALPDRDGRTVTLLLHPGRIKTGLGPNTVLGPALHAGDVVTLQVDDPQLGQPLRKRWAVTPARHDAIDPALWALQAPAAGTRAALELGFPAPLQSVAQRMIAVVDSQGDVLAGHAQLTADERGWRFTPDRHWSAGRYVLHVHPALEDVAGNRVCAGFEQLALRSAACDRDGQRVFAVRAVAR